MDVSNYELLSVAKNSEERGVDKHNLIQPKQQKTLLGLQKECVKDPFGSPFAYWLKISNHQSFFLLIAY